MKKHIFYGVVLLIILENGKSWTQALPNEPSCKIDRDLRSEFSDIMELGLIIPDSLKAADPT